MFGKEENSDVKGYSMVNTVNGMKSAIGQTVSVRFEDLNIDCKIIDAKNAYGKTRLLIAPISGAGNQWIETSRIVEWRKDG